MSGNSLTQCLVTCLKNDIFLIVFDIFQNWSEIVPESINWHQKQFFVDIFIQNHRFYEDLKNIRFQPKTSGNRDSRHQNSQTFHADACVRCCAGSLSMLTHGAKHSLWSKCSGWPPVENQGLVSWVVKVTLCMIYLRWIFRDRSLAKMYI